MSWSSWREEEGGMLQASGELGAAEISSEGLIVGAVNECTEMHILRIR